MSKGFGVRLAAAMFLAGPAAIHFAVAPEHLRTIPLYGLLFLALGGLQAALAMIIVLRPSALVLLGGAAMSLAAIGVWLWSRTLGGEPVGLPDLLTVLMEWISVWLLLAADARLASLQPLRVSRAAPALALSLVVTTALTVAGLAAVGGMH